MQGNIVTISRDGKPVNIEEDDLQKGDVLLLQAGDLVPADLKLTEARGLELDEWDLTGEIVPVARRVNGDDVYVYRGSRVTRGDGRGVVTATGEETEYAECLKQSWERPQYGLPRLLSKTSLLLLVALLPPFTLALLRYDNHVAVALLAGAVAVLTILVENSDLFDYLVTTREARRIAQHGIRLRDLASLEVAERLNVVCLDKTGVMTTRDLKVKRIYLADAIPDLASFAAGEEVARLTRIGCALCNDVAYAEKTSLANPIDQALIAFARAHGTDIAEAQQEYRRIYDQPFDSEARYMAGGFKSHGETLYFAKGDPEVVLKMCQGYVSESGGEQRADWPFWMSTRTRSNAISETGDIVIALAYALCSAETPPSGYTFLCLIQLENPLQPSLPRVLKELKGLGIRAVMLTGDRPETALKVGTEAGLVAGQNLYLTGKEIAHMGAWDIGQQATYVSIFARLLPSQKGLLVRLLRRQNGIVAMVGDGANDTVALKAADVGIAFGSNASPIARRVSQIFINDLADLVTIVQGARRIRQSLDDLAALRAMILLATLLGLYAWLLKTIW